MDHSCVAITSSVYLASAGLCSLADGHQPREGIYSRNKNAQTVLRVGHRRSKKISFPAATPHQLKCRPSHKAKKLHLTGARPTCRKRCGKAASLITAA